MKEIGQICVFSPQIPKDSVFDKKIVFLIKTASTLLYTHDYTRHVFI